MTIGSEPPNGVAAAAVKRNPTAVLALVAVAQFMVILDASVVNVAIPTIKRDLGFSEETLSWILNAYTLVFGGFLLLGGRAADRLGRRRTFVAGVALFSAASLMCGLSRSEGMLLVARGAQGLGGALVSPAALSIILTTFAEGHETRGAGFSSLCGWRCHRRWWPRVRDDQEFTATSSPIHASPSSSTT